MIALRKKSFYIIDSKVIIYKRYFHILPISYGLGILPKLYSSCGIIFAAFLVNASGLHLPLLLQSCFVLTSCSPKSNSEKMFVVENLSPTHKHYLNMIFLHW